jgi:hypothetical protein
MSCMYFLRQFRPSDDSTESSASITYWRKLLASPAQNRTISSSGDESNLPKVEVASSNLVSRSQPVRT